MTVAAAEPRHFDERSIGPSDLPADAPAFEQYPMTESFNGVLAGPDTSSDLRSRMFRTVIREGAKTGPNFAGHYTLVFWGCGSGCTSLAIVDANTGRVFHPEMLQTIDNHNIDPVLENADGRLIDFHLESNLLVVIGGINEEPTKRGISYFMWKDNVLRRIRFIPKPA